MVETDNVSGVNEVLNLLTQCLCIDISVAEENPLVRAIPSVVVARTSLCTCVRSVPSSGFRALASIVVSSFLVRFFGLCTFLFV